MRISSEEAIGYALAVTIVAGVVFGGVAMVIQTLVNTSYTPPTSLMQEYEECVEHSQCYLEYNSNYNLWEITRPEE